MTYSVKKAYNIKKVWFFPIVAALLASACVTSPALSAQILPKDFFQLIPAKAGSNMAVEADTMVFQQKTETVTAAGNVGINYQGYRVTADNVVYYQRTNKVILTGNVSILDPDGVEYIAQSVEFEDDFKKGFITTLTAAMPDGTYFTADETSLDQGIERVYINGVWAPCGECIGVHGKPIGWKVKSARIVTDEQDNTMYFEAPALEVWGFQIAQLPWLSMPTDEDIEFPLVTYDDDYGYGISMPVYRDKIWGGELKLTPAIFSNQGVHARADWSQKVGKLDYKIGISGLYQLNPGQYKGLANRELRGAIQTSGKFVPDQEWELGWSFTAFTDPSYLPDYRIATGTQRQQIYARYLTQNTYAEAKVQEYLPIDDNDFNWMSWEQFQRAKDNQAFLMPSARFNHVEDLADNAGRIELSGRLLGLHRNRDHYNSRFDYGHAGTAAHAMVQASWQKQYIDGSGVVITPYAGLRGDAANWENSKTNINPYNDPQSALLFTATPIAALDIRYPLNMRTDGASHIIEPIVQISYRGGISDVGIVNNDSQHAAFNGSTLFSFNRFSGTDRQETGLRANIGAVWNTSFDSGAWLTATVGQSFQLAGENAYAPIERNVGTIATGLGNDASYFVAAVEGGFSPYLTGAMSVRYDTEKSAITDSIVNLTSRYDGYVVSAGYSWFQNEPLFGNNSERQEVTLNAEIPLVDYWSLTGGIAWDIHANQWLQSTAGIKYDDDFLSLGLSTRFTGATHRNPNEQRYQFSVRLRAAAKKDVLNFGYSLNQNE